MFCPYCGTESKAPGAMFCAKCGRPLNAAIDAPSTEAPVLVSAGEIQARAWLAWPFWLLLVCVIGSVAGYMLPLLAGHKPMTQSITGVLVWTGALMAYVWKKQGRSGWVGFGLGLLIACTFFVVASYAAAFADRNDIAAGFEEVPHGKVGPKDPLGLFPKAEAPKQKFVHPDDIRPLPFEEGASAPK